MDTNPIYSKIRKTYKILDDVIKLTNTNSIYIAYSGGKDSTALSLLVLEWLIHREDKENIHVEIFHNDTLSELSIIENWTRSFMNNIVATAKSLGLNFTYKIITPEAKDTFYYKVLVRGYPAPTFKFRWCTWILKRKPTIKYLNEVQQRNRALILLGTRDAESQTRLIALNRKTNNISKKGLEYYLLSSEDYKKVAPIRDWKDKDIWDFLYLLSKKYKDLLSYIFKLYKFPEIGEIRYGCWFCTVVNVQKANLINEKYKYYEASRIIYKILSNTEDMRLKKQNKKGYSSLSVLNKYARAIMYWLFKSLEKLSNEKLYGLDEAYIKNYSLRSLFYEMDPTTANDIIMEYDKKTPKRIILDADFGEIPYIGKNKLSSRIEKVVKLSLKYIQNRKRLYANTNIDKYIKDIVDDILSSLS